MKLAVIFLILCLNSYSLFSQCDTLEILSKNQSDLFFKINKYEEKIDFLSEAVGIFINCEYFEEAISWQFSKILFASSISNLEDQRLFIVESQELLTNYAQEITDQELFEYKLKISHFWFDFYHKTGNYSKSLMYLSLEKLSKESVTSSLSQESIIQLRKIFLDKGREYTRKKEHYLAIEYFEEALIYALARNNEAARISYESLIYGLISNICLRIGDLDKAKDYCTKHLVASTKLLKSDQRRYSSHYTTALKRLTEWHILTNSLDSALHFINQTFIAEKRFSLNSYDSKILFARILLASGRTEEANEYLNLVIEQYSESILFNGSKSIRRCLDMSTLLNSANNYSKATMILDYTSAQLRSKMSPQVNFGTPIFHRNEGYMLDLLSKEISLNRNNNIDSLIFFYDSAFTLINKGFKSISTKYDKLLFSRKSLVLTENLLDRLPFVDEIYHEKAFSVIEASKAATLFNAWKQKQYYTLNDSEGLFHREQIIEDKLGSVSKQFLLSNDSTKSSIQKMKLTI